MSKIIAMSQHKGGVGKTVSTINLGAALAEIGKKVLLVDMDPQAALTQSLGFNPAELDLSIYDVLAHSEVAMSEVMMKSQVDGLELVPSHINLAVADLQFAGRVGRERILRKKLDPVRDGYDFILIDCPPTLGLLTINALAAADSVIMPIQCELLSLYGLKHLLDTIELVREEVNDSLQIGGFLLTMYDGRTRLSRDVEENVRETFDSLVFKTVIRRRIKLAEAPAVGQPITVFASRSDAAKDYRHLARELLSRE